MIMRIRPHTLLNLAAMVMACGVFAAGSTPAVGATVALIDFGRDTNTTGGYNNYAFGDGTEVLDTGWSLTVTADGSGNGNAGSGADADVTPEVAIAAFDTSAWEDSIYEGGGSTPALAQLTVSITGLDNGKTYDLLFFGARGNNGASDQTWSLTEGSGGADYAQPSVLDNTAALSWSGLSTNGSNEIAFTISNASSTGSSPITLNFGSVSEVPEPTEILIICFGGIGLAFGRHRRRNR